MDIVKVYPCGKCFKNVESRYKSIYCDGCKLWLHFKCSGLSKKEFEAASLLPDADWFCEGCLRSKKINKNWNSVEYQLVDACKLTANSDHSSLPFIRDVIKNSGIPDDLDVDPSHVDNEKYENIFQEGLDAKLDTKLEKAHERNLSNSRLKNWRCNKNVVNGESDVNYRIATQSLGPTVSDPTNENMIELDEKGEKYLQKNMSRSSEISAQNASVFARSLEQDKSECPKTSALNRSKPPKTSALNRSEPPETSVRNKSKLATNCKKHVQINMKKPSKNQASQKPIQNVRRLTGNSQGSIDTPCDKLEGKVSQTSKRSARIASHIAENCEQRKKNFGQRIDQRKESTRNVSEFYEKCKQNEQEMSQISGLRKRRASNASKASENLEHRSSFQSKETNSENSVDNGGKNTFVGESIARKLNYGCVLCGEMFFLRENAEDHYSIHKDIGDFREDVFKMEQRIGFQFQFRNRKIEKCEHCERFFANGDRLEYHKTCCPKMVAGGSGMRNKRKRMREPGSAKSDDSKKRKSNGKQGLIKSDIKKDCKSKQGLIESDIKKSRNRESKCDACGKFFANTTSLDYHKLYCQKTIRKNLEKDCEQGLMGSDIKKDCGGKQGSSGSGARKITVKGKGEGGSMESGKNRKSEFECDACGKFFANTTRLQYHKVYCPKTIAGSVVLSNLELKDVQGLLKSDVDEGCKSKQAEDGVKKNRKSDFQCDACGKVFANTTTLAYHKLYCQKTIAGSEKKGVQGLLESDIKNNCIDERLLGAKKDCRSKQGSLDSFKKKNTKSEQVPATSDDNQNHQSNNNSDVMSTKEFEIYFATTEQPRITNARKLSAEKISCSMCDKIFSIGKLKQHAKSHFTVRTSQNKTKNSRICELNQRAIEKKKTNECALCRKMFSLAFSLNRHMEIVHNDKCVSEKVIAQGNQREVKGNQREVKENQREVKGNQREVKGNQRVVAQNIEESQIHEENYRNIAQNVDGNERATQKIKGYRHFQRNVAILQSSTNAKIIAKDCRKRNCACKYCAKHNSKAGSFASLKINVIPFAIPGGADKTFEIGRKVFAKVKGYPYWPATIERDLENSFLVRFYGTDQDGVCKKNDVVDFESNRMVLGSRNLKNAKFVAAMSEACADK